MSETSFARLPSRPYCAVVFSSRRSSEDPQSYAAAGVDSGS